MKGGAILPILLVGLTPLLVFTLIIVGVAVGPVRWQPPNLWSREFGTSALNVDNRVTAVSADQGGFYAAGYVGYAPPVANVSSSYLFVSRYDSSGREVWIQTFGNPTTDELNGVAQGTDGVYVVGHFYNSAFVKKYGLQGSPAWTLNLTGMGPSALDVSIGTTGAFFIIADTLPDGSEAVTFRGSDFDGNVLWTRLIGNSTIAFSVSAARNGLYVSGSSNSGSGFVGRYNFSGEPVWSRQLSCVCRLSSVSTDETGVYVAGQTGPFFSDAFVAKFDWDGNQLWMHQFKPVTIASVGNVRMSADPSGVYIAMITTIGNYLSKYDRNGNSEWTFQIRSEPHAVSVDGGGVVVGGTNANRGGKLAFLSEYSRSSSLIFFGINPPFSFIVVGVMAGSAAISLWWLWKHTGARLPSGRLQVPKRNPADSVH